MQRTTNKKDKTMDIFISWLNENGAEFPDIYFQTYKKMNAVFIQNIDYQVIKH